MKRAVFVLSCWLLSLAFPVEAAPFGGRELHDLMQRPGDARAYENYILGVSDGLTGTSLYYYCPPVNIDRGSLREIVTRYLKQHPEDLHVPAGALVTAALIEAHPCRKKP